MAEIHLWTAQKWYCPLCPTTLLLCSSSNSLMELTSRITDHLMTHRMMVQHLILEDVSHVVVVPTGGFAADLTDAESWNAARAVVGQVIEGA